jgi:hypothetical protein
MRLLLLVPLPCLPAGRFHEAAFWNSFIGIAVRRFWAQ